MPESATLPRSGLFTTAEVPVPLTGVSVDAEISKLCARVSITQRFVNRESSRSKRSMYSHWTRGRRSAGSRR